MKTCELTGELLDYWALRADGWKPEDLRRDPKSVVRRHPFVTWEIAVQIIEREGIDTFRRWKGQARDGWFAQMLDRQGCEVHAIGETIIIAAMRCFVASRLGDEVEDLKA